MSQELIRSSRPFFPKEDINAILSDLGLVLEEGKLRNGKNLKTFEKIVSDYLGIKYALSLDSDSSALETVLQYYKIKDREVIVSTNSFISIPNSVLYAGGQVVFADIKKETLSMNPVDLYKKITAKTCGVILTHIAGFPHPELNKIQEFCQNNHLFLIEDATHAMGAAIADQKIGTFGDAAIFAFTPTKVATTGEGGMLVTNDSQLADYARLYSYYGSGPEKTQFVNLGRHMLLPEIAAILGIYQMRRIEEFIAKRNQIAAIYNEAFDQINGLDTVKVKKDNRCSYYKYPLILNSKFNKAEIQKKLLNNRVETGTIFYPPCHMQTIYASETKNRSLLNAEDVLTRTITLPMHTALTDQDISQVVTSVKKAIDC
ncbi:DegT/DnrJ/EryC1/StrS family aminotransferase [Candidatus Bathycorpusculum sp.]|uniref:DegT/DnrJ/EryC1/StrS family aminotransferase n=1 Tax=Candidatus Bathycorpusculum sp. TaxID=2994959 RepID=UPI0028283C36|nr:DegT/DnrJ/EryC1/StrS family aminotransferase [Candidatus Termitimicrobium sp.]MCL2686288.1 DegT/DnrJ/EryC1/StrS family aminotransferase [Candidatus Termitimicrobium sp.]